MSDRLLHVAGSPHVHSDESVKKIMWSVVIALMPSISEDAGKVLAFSKTANPFIGIISGIIGSLCYNRFKSTKLPNWLSFFSGKRCVAIVAGVFSIFISFILVADIVRWSDCSGSRYCFVRCCRSRIICLFKQTSYPDRFASCLEQCFLV